VGMNYGCSAWILNGYSAGLFGSDQDPSLITGVLAGSNRPLKHYYAFKNYAKYVRRGAVEIQTTIPSSNTNLTVASFHHMADSTYTIVIVNSDTINYTPYPVQITGNVPSTGWTAYRTSENERCQQVNIFSNGLYMIAPASVTTLNFDLKMNHPPAINQAGNISSGANQISVVNLTGISASDPGQSIVITATSSDTSIAVVSVINYISPAASGTLNITTTSKAGVAFIRVKVQDNGGTANGGIDTTIMTFTVDLVLRLTDISEKVKLYPNPANANVTLVLPSELNNGEMSIINTSGQFMMQQKIQTDGIENVNISYFPTGIYAIKIVNNNYAANLTFIKN